VRAATLYASVCGDWSPFGLPDHSVPLLFEGGACQAWIYRPPSGYFGLMVSEGRNGWLVSVLSPHPDGSLVEEIATLVQPTSLDPLFIEVALEIPDAGGQPHAVTLVLTK
jgi:hypothetical protein